MLAWIFWHSRFAEIPEPEYRAALTAFHERIAAAAPDGFLGSRIVRYDAIPWLHSATEIYEDWYFVRDSAALDALDEAALAAFTQDAHARVARLAATAISGLYRLRAGSPLANPSRCFWMSKPRGDSYDAFIARISSASAVWSRKMVLGPTPEFCVESETESESLRAMADHPLQSSACAGATPANK